MTFNSNYVRKGSKIFILMIILLIYPMITNAQELSKTDMKRLEILGVTELYESYQKNNYPTSDFNTIIKLDKGVETGEISGGIFRTIGSVGLGLGAALVLTSDSSDAGFAGVIGALSMGVGVASYGISIPLKLSAKKKIKRRDNLIKQLKNESK